MKTELKSKCCGATVGTNEIDKFVCMKCCNPCECQPAPQSETPSSEDESHRIDIPTLQGLLSYLNHQYPATRGDLMLHKICKDISTLDRELSELEHRLIDLSIKGTGANANQFKFVGELAVAGLWNMKELLQQELTKANERIAILEKECQQNNQAACLFDRDTALAELATVKKELETRRFHQHAELSGEVAKLTIELSDTKALNQNLIAANSEHKEKRDSALKQRDQLGHLLTGGSLTEQQVVESGLGVGVLIEKRHAEAQRDLLAKQNHKMNEYLKHRLGKFDGRSLTTEEHGEQNWIISAVSNNTSSLIVLTRAEVDKLPCGCSDTYRYEALKQQGDVFPTANLKCPRCLLLERVYEMISPERQASKLLHEFVAGDSKFAEIQLLALIRKERAMDKLQQHLNDGGNLNGVFWLCRKKNRTLIEAIEEINTQVFPNENL